mgnify:FL=1|tara:strand:+ start:356 stop:661 length:306 start_codon:yes stop_codon:yes gene_type:complete
MQSIPVFNKLNGIKGSCFSIQLEYNEDFIILHLPIIDKMTKEVLIEMKTMLSDWWLFVKTIGYKAIFAAVETTHKVNKLLQMLDFKYIGEDKGYFVYQFKE